MIHFSYNIKDKVRLAHEIPYPNIIYGHDPFDANQVYEIRGYGWKEVDPGIVVPFYILDIETKNGHRYLTYYNKLSETDLVPAGESHPFDDETDLYSNDGNLIEIGDRVYCNILSGNGAINWNFTFAGYGSIVEKSHIVESGTDISHVMISREFLCHNKEGMPLLDSRREGSIHQEYAMSVTKDVPPDYAERYVDAIIGGRRGNLLDPNGYDYFDVKSWLNHIGVFDKVVTLYEERKSSVNSVNSVKGKNPKRKKPADPHGKVEKILSSLSEDEKEEMKKILLQS